MTDRPPLDEALIRRRAYELWEAAGRPAGFDRDHWLEAKWQIMGELARPWGASTAGKVR